MKLLNYQIDAIEEIIELIPSKENIKLQAPTGSGKTFITANLIKRITESNWALSNKKITFLYIAPSTGQLDYQGFSKIRDYLDKGFVNGFSVEYIGSTDKTKTNYLTNISYLEKNKVYFIGWDLLKTTSKAFSDGENMNLFDVVRATHERGTKIILLVDEAHREYAVNSKTMKQDFISELNPLRTIEMTATTSGKPDVRITSQAVREAGVIKQNIIINSISDNFEIQDKLEELIQNGLDKRKEIEDSTQKTNKKDLVPLMLIQIPDGNPKVNGTDVNDYFLNLIDKVMERNNLKKDYDYAIWLDKVKTTKDKDLITKDSSPFKVVVFKQAIATGWDVPRASVLVKLRNPKNGSKSFEVQTLGRILRNPHLTIFKVGGRSGLNKKDVDNLNNAFVFTNDQDWANDAVNDFEGKDVKNLMTFKLSQKAKNNRTEMYKVAVKQENIQDIDFVVEYLLKDDEFVETLVKDINVYRPSRNDSLQTQTLNGAGVAEMKVVIDGFIDSMDLSNDDYSLFYLHVRFLNTIKNNNVIKKFVNRLSHEKSVNKKMIYKFFIEKFSQSYLRDDTLAIAFNSRIAKAVSSKIDYVRSEKFELLDEIEYFESEANEDPDGLFNSYELTFNKEAFDSDIEYDFYQDLFKRRNNFSENTHVFRNKTNPGNSYYTEYFNLIEARVANFFPDFIVTTEKNILIIECKGLGQNNVDKNVDSKMESIFKNLISIKENKEVFLVKIGNHKGGEYEYQLIDHEGKINQLKKDEFFKLLNK